MKTPPIDRQLIERLSTALGIEDFERATIREIKALAAEAERISGVEFIKMEMGVPGLPACALGIETETAALQSGVASLYADMEGIPELKAAASRFLKTFTGIELSPMGCIPVVGSMQGSYAAFTTCLQCHDSNKRILFIDPGFPVQKLQLKVMGAAFESFDVHDYRGNKLRDKLESYLKEGDVAALIYSNPNNPSWFNFKDEELRLIGETAARYDTTVIEDLAYFGMDFRRDPKRVPLQPSVAGYCDNYILLLSASKTFSYAGQRIGMLCMSDKLYERHYPALDRRYGPISFGSALVFRVLYALSAGVAHATQHALAAMLDAASSGRYRFNEELSEYGRRAKRLKEIFLRHGFRLLYDNDLGEALADGFYFSLAWPGMSGGDLARELMYYGLSSIPLSESGSRQEGIRICCSFVRPEQYEILDERMACFARNHTKNENA